MNKELNKHKDKYIHIRKGVFLKTFMFFLYIGFIILMGINDWNDIHMLHFDYILVSVLGLLFLIISFIIDE